MFQKILSVLLSFLIAFMVFIPMRSCYSQEIKEYTLAVLDLEPYGVSKVVVKGLSEKIRSRISWVVNSELYRKNPVTERYVIVERTQMEKIFNQYDVQNIGCVAEECAIEFGRMLQSDRIVIGSISLLGRTYSITTRMIDVETGRTLHISEKDRSGSIDGLLGSTIQDVADELILGRPYKDWGNSEYISISGNPEGANVSVNRKNVGKTPVNNTLIPLGNNSIKIKKSGYEDYYEKVRIEKGEPIKLNYFMIPKTRIRTFTKSIFFPGNGQRYAEYRAKGNIISLLQITTVAGIVGTTVMKMNAQDEYDDAKDIYYNSTKQDEFSRAFKDMEDKYDKITSAQTLQMISAGAALTVYLYNLIDAAMTEPKGIEQSMLNTIHIEPTLTKEYSAISLSVRF